MITLSPATRPAPHPHARFAAALACLLTSQASAQPHPSALPDSPDDHPAPARPPAATTLPRPGLRTRARIALAIPAFLNEQPRAASLERYPHG